MKDNNKGLGYLADRRQSLPAEIDGTVISIEFMAEQAWIEGLRQFVELKRVERPGYVLGDDYELFLSEMNVEERQQYWRRITDGVPHSAGAYFANHAEFFRILEDRLSEVLEEEK